MTDTLAANTETSAGSDGLSGVRLSRGTLIRRRFLRNKLAVLGVAIVVFMFVLAFVGPYLTKWTYT
ncbi:MAG: hypothetical protein ACKO8P_04185, partial [Actinomycetota bacterium]